MHAVAPLAFWYLPSSHAVHSWLRSLMAYVPLPHLEASTAPAKIFSSAGAVTDLIAKNLYYFRTDPATGKRKLAMAATSVVLRKKAREEISPDFVMATQSMNAVFAVASFRSLDKNNDGIVDANDIVSAFARVGAHGPSTF